MDIIDEMIKQMEQGHKIICTDEQYDEIIERTTDHVHCLKLASLPNPDQVGFKDKWVAFFKGI